MEPIIDKLSEIETAAARIMESAVNETKTQDKKSEERIALFDAEVETATQKKLEALRTDLQKQSVEELLQLQNSMEKTLENMDNNYNTNHHQITDEIYHKIIRM